MVVQFPVERLVESRGADKPVGELVFRCKRCGQPGEVRVTEAGNLTIGFRQVWPETQSGL
jgi:hypothetical protein